MPSLFAYTPENPYQFSVGAVLQREDGKICCHHYSDSSINPIRPHDLYLLMRETVEENESLESALARGLMEEFGAKAEPVRFLGSLLSHYQENGVRVEKTTTYILCGLLDIDANRRDDHPENQSTVEWQDAEMLIAAMQKQATQTERTDLCEADILTRI